MWLAVLTAVSLTARVVSQHSYVNQKLQQSGTNLQWGWQLSPLDAVLDQYYVQPLQNLQFTDIGVYPNFGSLPSGPAPAVSYNLAIPNQLYQNSINDSHPQNNLAQGNANPPVNFYYAPQQYPVSELQTLQSAPGNLIQYNLPENTYNSNRLPNAGHNIQTEHTLSFKEGYQPETSKLPPVVEKKETISPIVQVFKDHNCTDDTKTAREYSSNIQKTAELAIELPSYDDSDISGIFGAKDTLQSTPESKIERTRGNTNNEGYYYYTTEVSHAEAQRRDEQEGISRLVASTQDLISNDDLLRINHAIEKHVFDIGEDHIKPLHNNPRIERNGNQPQNHITLSAKISRIENQAVDSDQEQSQQKILESKFTSPIVVQDSTDEDLHEKIIDTLVSTMSPYIDDGYQIISMTQQNDTKTYVPFYKGQTVHVTPRPVGQKYLAPITVALRLLNSNQSVSFNSIDDHDTSDTEVIEETVKSPPKERTIVEIQQSFPVDITHINEVEVHEYMEEGRSNPNTFDAARNLFNKYMTVLQAERQNEENRNRAVKSNDVSQDNENADKLEPSENVRSEVIVNQNMINNDKQSENYYDRNINNGNVIQPIVIEKEIQVPQFIDRYIEKPVPYAQPVEVVKQVPVDRPVPVPYEKIVEKPVKVTEYIDKPFPVPYPVHHKVYIDRPIHVPYPVERIVEKQVVHNVPVPTPVAVPVNVPVEKPVLYPVEVEKPVPIDRVVEKEVPVPYPVPYEQKVPVTVEKIVEKPVPVHIPVHIYKPVDRIVEKKVPYIVPVDRVVEKKVQVRIPYPIEKVVEKIVEKPVVVTKYIDRPYPVETKVPYYYSTDNKFPYPIEVPYTNNAYFNDATKQESQNRPHYVQYQGKHTANPLLNKLNYYPKGNLNYQGPNSVPIQTTQWGNSYASSYTYINGTNNQEVPLNHLEYVTRNDNYYGPPPMHSYDSMWERNAHSSRDNVERNDRRAKVANLRIEYGGFKPPLIPSTEVDLDGRPINKEEER